MLNGIFIALIMGAVLWAAFDLGSAIGLEPPKICVVESGTVDERVLPAMECVTKASLDSAKSAVTLAIGLIGMMAFWLGMLRVLREAGAMAGLARALAPVMRRLFPEIPPEHPAMGAMIMNIAANMAGLGNAATPFGLKAMRELDTLNSHKGVATNSMALFLAINTSGVAVLPLGVIAIRASLDSTNAGGIFFPSLLATFCSTVVGITVALALQNRAVFAPGRLVVDTRADDAAADGETLADGIKGISEAEEIATIAPPVRPWGVALAVALGTALALALVRHVSAMPAEATAMDVFREIASSWVLPLLMFIILAFALSRRINVYDHFIAGAREGFDIAVMIIPFLVAILVAVGVFRASGGLEALILAISQLTDPLGFPAEVMPMALIRPLSGSGAMAVMVDTMQTHGPDSFPGFVVSVMNGSTETTFYVLAVYLGSVRVRAARHTVVACLAADFTGVIAAVVFSRIFF